MELPLFGFVYFVACVACAQAASALIENGRARAEIVLAEKPARMATLATRELQTYLEKISGAKLEIVAKPGVGKAHIFVGKGGSTKALKLSTDGMENCAFRMASGEDWLALLGPDEDYAPIEPWGRVRSTAESARVNTSILPKASTARSRRINSRGTLMFAASACGGARSSARPIHPRDEKNFASPRSSRNSGENDGQSERPACMSFP